MEDVLLESAQCTDPGRVRALNEDALFVDARLGLAVLADGMGGYNAGEVASGMAAALLASNFTRRLTGSADQEIARKGGPEAVLREEVLGANQAIFNAAQRQPQYAGMGTTLVVAWIYRGVLHTAHVGDSRLYRLRDGHLSVLTRDHSLLQEQLDRGMISPEEARVSNHRNLVTRALGIESGVEVELHQFDIASGDVLLLCSDGLNDMLDDHEIAAVLKASGNDLQVASRSLVEAANLAGGKDNVSVILMRVNRCQVKQRSLWQRIVGVLG